MADNVLYASDVTVSLGDPYIGSAYSPQVAITDTEDGHEVTFTYADSEHPGQLTTASYDVPNYSDEEAAREAAEAQRQAYEAQRRAAEDARKAAESARAAAESSRVSAENERRGYEQGRQYAEAARQQAEAARAAAESARAGAESNRQSSEQARKDAENARQFAEHDRRAAEELRAEAESARESAEAAREAAEQARETDTAAAIARADAATAAANTATTNAQAATTAAQAATGEAETATDAANAAAALATAAAETVTDAYFPDLTAGAAEGITGGGPTDTAAWLQRSCLGTDGPATIESIHGRTLVWNQLIQAMSRSATALGVTAVMNGDGSVTLSGTATKGGTVTIYTGIPITAGHKYLISGAPVSAAEASYMNISGLGRDRGSGDIFTYTSSINGGLRYAFISGQVLDATFWPQLYDLTAMFGAGNEPSTVAEFEALYPLPYYPYDAGSLLSVNMTGIESADADGNVLMERTIPAVTYFPNGMRSAGPAHDELTATSAITRIGVVNLGTLTFSASSVSHVYYCILSKAYGATNFVCTDYETVNVSAANMGDMQATSSNLQPRIYFRNDSCDTAGALKRAMNGVMLYYEQGTPTTQTIDPPLNLIYRAENGGTERITHTDLTAVPTLVITYGSTADGIRDRALACIAPIEGSTASANYGVGSYLIHDGQLCRVTTAIATGEAITIGTNVTATTVMAEILTLTQ